ncbi:MAG: PilZ domain-containing protein [Candidatus Heimdallarchaeota archaeon]|nr:PilZ domain-containing protein [Candidatus Heimdallarchaeota archaeon]
MEHKRVDVACKKKGRGEAVEKERRKFKRFDAYMSVKFKTEDGVDISGVCLSNDLSRDGMKLTTSTQLSSGTLVDMEIDIPDDPKPVRSTSEIVWTRKCGDSENDFESGIRFLMMDPVDKFRVLDYAYNNWLETKVDDYADPEDILE